MSHTAKNTMPVEANHKWLKRLNNILDEHLAETDLDNERLADLMNISERQFYRKVKAATQQTPNHYIRTYRLKKAKSFLETGTFRTEREACFAVGYVNTTYFKKQFVSLFGKTPLQLLRENGWR
ncbi:MAG: helix-turn-helix domain-containing protein [Bacteroidota bacterium]